MFVLKVLYTKNYKYFEYNNILEIIKKCGKMRRCKNCLIPEGFHDIKFNKDGICNLCLENKIIDNSKDKIQCKMEFEKYINKIRGKSEYDCLLLYSGGKDSTYLLYKLKVKYNLNVLAVTIDTGLGNPIAKKNIKKSVSVLNVDHLTITPRSGFYKKLYRFFVCHNNKKTETCGLCQKIMHSIALNIAYEKKIPFVAQGYSPDQADEFEYSKEMLSKSWIPKELFKKPFNEYDRGYFWNPENINYNELPRFIFPFYAIDYPGVEKIIDELSKHGLGSKRNFNPHYSNCHLVWLCMKLDIKKFNFNPYDRYFSKQIREGKTISKFWSVILPVGSWFLKHGFIKRKEVNSALNFLNLRFEEIS